MAVSTEQNGTQTHRFEVINLDDVVVRLAGDSGDGMQLAGTQMSSTSAIFGNDISTLPDYPAEIRAPAGTLAGVSGFQLHFGARRLRTPGDQVNALVALNPAALKVNLPDLEPGGVLIVNDDAFTQVGLSKAAYEENPLADGSLDGYRLFRVPMEQLTAAACKDTGLSPRAISRCKNFFALGLVYWLFDRSPETTLGWIEKKFKAHPAVAAANTAAVKAGYNFGETAELFTVRYQVCRADIQPGRYRRINGNEAVALGLITAARRAGKPLFYGSYPITPASEILHELSKQKKFDVRTFQAEDEIAAVTSSIGAAFAGALAASGTSGPGVALKSEGIGLAVMAELPLVIIDVQRAGPSTGLPTKTEQGDLFQVLWGRNSEAPVCVLAASTPADCFAMTLEACRIAVEYMTPVVLLSDSYLSNGAQPWRIPDVESLPRFAIRHPKAGEPFQPYRRDERLVRPWALPGTPGLQHRIGGLEKRDVTGDVSYEPENHEHMCRLRRRKIDKIAETIPPLEVNGDASGELLVLGWGSTYGPITAAVDACRARGLPVSSAHLQYLDPLPPNTGAILERFSRVLVPEINLGQLVTYIRAKFLVDAVGFNKLQGKPFMVGEIQHEIERLLDGTTT
jgi:2-oxoglutarate ferredoxin oxidoreductase subunit alpha